MVDLAGGEAVGVGVDGRLGDGGAGGQGEAGGDGGGDEASPVQSQGRQQAVEMGVLVFHHESPGKGRAAGRQFA